MIDIKNLRLIDHDPDALKIIANKEGTHTYFKIYQVYVEGVYMSFGQSKMKYYSTELFATKELATRFFENEVLPMWKKDFESEMPSMKSVDLTFPLKVEILAQRVYLV